MWTIQINSLQALLCAIPKFAAKDKRCGRTIYFNLAAERYERNGAARGAGLTQPAEAGRESTAASREMKRCYSQTTGWR